MRKKLLKKAPEYNFDSYEDSSENYNEKYYKYYYKTTRPTTTTSQIPKNQIYEDVDEDDYDQSWHLQIDQNIIISTTYETPQTHFKPEASNSEEQIVKKPEIDSNKYPNSAELNINEYENKIETFKNPIAIPQAYSTKKSYNLKSSYHQNSISYPIYTSKRPVNPIYNQNYQHKIFKYNQHKKYTTKSTINGYKHLINIYENKFEDSKLLSNFIIF